VSPRFASLTPLYVVLCWLPASQSSSASSSSSSSSSSSTSSSFPAPATGPIVTPPPPPPPPPVPGTRVTHKKGANEMKVPIPHGVNGSGYTLEASHGHRRLQYNAVAQGQQLTFSIPNKAAKKQLHLHNRWSKAKFALKQGAHSWPLSYKKL
jgi:hypothetical protein